jgi:7,8-dihydroneopterin aldolase/epimerase/oxygenase
MLTVHLSDIKFFAHHGLYEQEQLTGNQFTVNLRVSYDERKLKLDNLKNLISYEALFQIVKKRMGNPTPLLEELAESIIRKIKHEFHGIKEISVSIFKMNAPIEGMDGKVGITLIKKFDD